MMKNDKLKQVDIEKAENKGGVRLG